ncbi:aminotransferase DegT [Acetobacter musti]|uniref:Aminotransferase DegT n=1 Tax=Acetobacter musti TaxID=864732 RepID=A0ABX0JN30_9PROT|nr:FAD-dependent oxidoreductase [Acetobacter musti]NHN83255.1 aminotransferase DegT [Acetobacter musti]
MTLNTPVGSLRQERSFRLVIVGGGPAGMATLLAAHYEGRLNELLDAGVAIIEQGDAPGAGALGDYAISSDSSGMTFVDCLRAPDETPLTALCNHPLTRGLAAAGEGAVALKEAARFLDLVGTVLRKMVSEHGNCEVLTRHTAAGVTRTAAGWRVKVQDRAGGIRFLRARNVVLCTGAHQPPERLATEYLGDSSLADSSLTALCGDRLVQSGYVLTDEGLDDIRRRLGGISTPRMAVIGGSTSAVAVCHAVLNRLPDVRFQAGGVSLLHRRELRVYYPDAASAIREGYTEFGPDDICGISGKVFRFAGFRLDSRELVMQARGIGGRAPEPRLRLHRLMPGNDPEALRLLAEADVVVAALGYRPRALPVSDLDGRPVRLMAQRGPQEPLVDDRCRVVTDAGEVLPGLFGLGLAAGFVPRGPLGGEPSFRGQANGLWLWQKDVGGLIVSAVLGPVGGEKGVSAASYGRPGQKTVEPVFLSSLPLRPPAASGLLYSV